MKRKQRQYLPFSQWPSIDRFRWQAAFAAGIDRFDDGGSGGHLSPHTKARLAHLYGTFLFFLAHQRPELLRLKPAKRITAQTVKEFVELPTGNVRLSYAQHLCLPYLAGCAAYVSSSGLVLAVKDQQPAQGPSKTKARTPSSGNQRNVIQSWNQTDGRRGRVGKAAHDLADPERLSRWSHHRSARQPSRAPAHPRRIAIK